MRISFSVEFLDLAGDHLHFPAKARGLKELDHALCFWIDVRPFQKNVFSEMPKRRFFRAMILERRPYFFLKPEAQQELPRLDGIIKDLRPSVKIERHRERHEHPI